MGVIITIVPRRREESFSHKGCLRYILAADSDGSVVNQKDTLRLTIPIG